MRFSQVYSVPSKLGLSCPGVAVCWLPFSFWFSFSHNVSIRGRVLCVCGLVREVGLKLCPQTGPAEAAGGNKNTSPLGIKIQEVKIEIIKFPLDRAIILNIS